MDLKLAKINENLDGTEEPEKENSVLTIQKYFRGFKSRE